MTAKTSPTILIVDDDHNMTETMEALLSHEFPQAQILTADSPQGGRLLLSQTHVDVVMSDYQLPGGDGVTFLQEARRHQPDVHCILMTGYPAVGLAVRAQREAQVDGMAVKPFNAIQLIGLVYHALNRDQGEFRYEAPS